MSTRMFIRIVLGIPALIFGVPLIIVGIAWVVTAPLSIMGAFGLVGFLRWTNPDKYLRTRSDFVHTLLFITLGLIAILPVIYLSFESTRNIGLLGLFSILGGICGLLIKVDLIRRLRAHSKGHDLLPLP